MSTALKPVKKLDKIAEEAPLVTILNRLTVKEYDPFKISHPKLHQWIHEDSEDLFYKLLNLIPFIENQYDPHRLANEKILRTAKFCGFNLIYPHIQSRFEDKKIIVEGFVDYYISSE